MAYVFCQDNVHIKGSIVYYPIYLIAFFEQFQPDDNIFKFDLSGLQ